MFSFLGGQLFGSPNSINFPDQFSFQKIARPAKNVLFREAKPLDISIICPKRVGQLLDPTDGRKTGSWLPDHRIMLRNMTPQDRHPLPKNESQAWRGRRMRDAWRDLRAAQATSRRRCAKFSRSLKTVRSFFLRDLRGNSQYLY